MHDFNFNACRLPVARVLVSFLCLTFLPLSARGMDTSWIQGEWISDPGASVAANPAFENLEAVQKEAAESMFGRMRWAIVGETLTTTYEDSDTGAAETHSATFATEYTESEDVRLLIVDEEAQTRLQLHQTHSGFCLRVSVWSVVHPMWDENTVVECFRRVSD